MGFKISLVPFHLWTADTYEGAPTVVTGFLSVISKGSAAFVLFTVLIKVFGAAELVNAWNQAFLWIIIASITIANLVTNSTVYAERLQDEATPTNLAQELLDILPGGPRHQAVVDGMDACVRQLGGGRNAAATVAENVLEVIKQSIESI